MADLSHEFFAERCRTPEHPVLFLDVDGVLNCEADFRAGHQLCQRKVQLLNKLPPCDIVVSSAWRVGVYGELVAAMWWMGCKKPVVGRTRSAQGGEVRGNQIEDWLRENGNPPYAIVDDEADMLEHQIKFFVQTDFRGAGLNDDAIRRLHDLLVV